MSEGRGAGGYFESGSTVHAEHDLYSRRKHSVQSEHKLDVSVTLLTVVCYNLQCYNTLARTWNVELTIRPFLLITPAATLLPWLLQPLLSTRDVNN